MSLGPPAGFGIFVWTKIPQPHLLCLADIRAPYVILFLCPFFNSSLFCAVEIGAVDKKGGLDRGDKARRSRASRPSLRRDNNTHRSSS